MKAKREHRVPLSEPTLKLLRERHSATGGQGYVFPGSVAKRPLSNMTMLKLLERIGRDDVTVHGFRSTFPCGGPFSCSKRKPIWRDGWLTRGFGETDTPDPASLQTDLRQR